MLNSTNSKKPIIYKELPVVSFKNSSEFYNWLAKYRTSEAGFWLRYYKKSTNLPTIQHGDAVDVALCWGYIDGLTNSYDEKSWVTRFTPRRAKSVWSQINVTKVERLIKEGRMQPSGLKLVDEAKADGRWQAAYAGPASMKVPHKFLALLKTDPDTYKFFKSLNKTNTYAIAYKIATTVGSEKKARKMQQLFKMLKDRKTFY